MSQPKSPTVSSDDKKHSLCSELADGFRVFREAMTVTQEQVDAANVLVHFQGDPIFNPDKLRTQCDISPNECRGACTGFVCILGSARVAAAPVPGEERGLAQQTRLQATTHAHRL